MPLDAVTVMVCALLTDASVAGSAWRHVPVASLVVVIATPSSLVVTTTPLALPVNPQRTARCGARCSTMPDPSVADRKLRTGGVRGGGAPSAAIAVERMIKHMPKSAGSDRALRTERHGRSGPAHAMLAKHNSRVR